MEISIHALREEGDCQRARVALKPLGISIHALREEGDCVLGYITIFTERISIHALREEGDWYGPKRAHAPFLFLSTPSARRATAVLRQRYSLCEISIHALREEGDVEGNKPKE